MSVFVSILADAEVPPAGVYAGIVAGDSMTGDDIRDGDLLLVDPDAAVADGDICIVHVRSETTRGRCVKHLFRDGETVRLVSSNPAYEPMVFPAGQVTVIGKVTGRFRVLDPDIILPRP